MVFVHGAESQNTGFEKALRDAYRAHAFVVSGAVARDGWRDWVIPAGSFDADHGGTVWEGDVFIV